MLIGLVGYKGHGKSFVANKLATEYGFGRINFKDALINEMSKNMSGTIKALHQIHYPSQSEDEGWLKYMFDHKPLGMRELMQNYGTEVRRGDSDTYWADKYVQSVKALAMTDNESALDSNVKIVTDDVRFLNEYEAIKKLGGKIIRVQIVDSNGDVIAPEDTHVSETEHLSIHEDVTVFAEKGDLDTLSGAIDAVMELLDK